MKQSWTDYERAAQSGPLPAFFKGLFGLLLIGGVMWGIGTALGWFGEAAAVVREEFGPREALRKYEWFKDAAAALDKKRADIAVYDARLSSLEAAYAGQERRAWARDDREQRNIWASEVAGIKASYNGLCAEYNAQMAKFNWRFAEAGRLPQGASEPLPREFKPYVSE